MADTEAPSVEKLTQRIKYLQERLRAEERQSRNLRSEAQRWERIAAEEHKSWMNAHNALNLVREDAQRVMRENGVTELQAELDRERELSARLKRKLDQRYDLTRRAVEGKVAATTTATDQAVTIDQMRTQMAQMEENHAKAVESGRKVIQSQQDRAERISEQCRLWKSGELDTMTAIAGITGEMYGHQLPAPGAWERAKAIKEAELRAKVTVMEDQLGQIVDMARNAGIDAVESDPVRAVKWLAKSLSISEKKVELKQAEVDQWKAWEAEARGATMRIVNTVWHDADEILTRLQAGQYNEAVALVHARVKGETESPSE
jgi:hypothetical protein